MQLTAFAVAVLAMAAAGSPDARTAPWCAVALVAGALLLAGAKRKGVAGVAPVCALVAAGGWVALSSRPAPGVALHPALAGVIVVATVRVDGSVSRDARGLRMTAVATDPTLPRRIAVFWPGAAVPASAGDCWRLRLRLRRLGGSHNPGGFDYRAWQLRRGIGARATVVAGRGNVRCDAAVRPGVAWVRERVRRSIAAADTDPDVAAVIEALALGERGNLSPDTRALLTRTGTAHLVAISGLHVGIVAALMLWLARLRGGSRRAPLTRRTALVALATATAYAALSGFALPARRAVVMLAVVLALQLGRRPLAPLRGVAVAALAVAMLRPAFVVDASFVLSFAAVTTLAVYGEWHRRRREPPRAITAALRMQLLLGVVLLPVSVFTFGIASALSLPANLFAVPWFSLVVVPLSLAAAVVASCAPVLAAPLWRADAALVTLALEGLRLLDDGGHAVIGARLPGGFEALVAAVLLGACVVARGAPGRSLLAVGLIAVVFAAPPRPPHGCARIAVLDVGHGTAVVVRDARGDAVYDTGPGYPDGGAAARHTLLPFLNRAATTTLRVAVLSHADADHTGGAALLADAASVARWVHGDGAAPPGAAASTCTAGQRWHAGGIEYAMLWPRDGMTGTVSDNDASCVLRISTGGASLLIGGDIEAQAERELVARRAARADAVLVPHHGSATSSTAPFVAAARARYAVVSADADGRWALPDDGVVARWQRHGTEVATTANGALGVLLCAGAALRLQDPDPWAETPGALW